jgi:hypothetical protein
MDTNAAKPIGRIRETDGAPRDSNRDGCGFALYQSLQHAVNGDVTIAGILAKSRRIKLNLIMV